LPKLKQAAAQSVCDSWASCIAVSQTPVCIKAVSYFQVVLCQILFVFLCMISGRIGEAVNCKQGCVWSVASCSDKVSFADIIVW